MAFEGSEVREVRLWIRQWAVTPLSLEFLHLSLKPVTNCHENRNDQDLINSLGDCFPVLV